MIMVRKTFFYSLESTVGLGPKKIIRRNHRFVGKPLVGWLVRWQTASVRNWKLRLTGSARKFPAIIYCYYRGFVRAQLSPSVLETVRFTMKRTTLALNPTGLSNEILLVAPSTSVKLPLCNRGRNGISLQEDIVFAFVDANCECLNFGTNSRWNYYCRFMARLEVAFLVKATTAIISNLDLFTLSYTDLYHVKWYLMETLLAIEAN